MIREIWVWIPLRTNILIFFKDALGILISILRTERYPIISQGSSKKYIAHDKGDRGLGSLKIDVFIFLKDILIF